MLKYLSLAKIPSGQNGPVPRKIPSGGNTDPGPEFSARFSDCSPQPTSCLATAEHNENRKRRARWRPHFSLRFFLIFVEHWKAYWLVPRACSHYQDGGAGGQFFSNQGARSDAYRGPRGQVCVRGVDTGCLLATINDESGKIGPGPSTYTPATKACRRGPGVAAKIRPYLILALDGEPAIAFGLGFVWPDFRPQRHCGFTHKMKPIYFIYQLLADFDTA